ncbi:rhomboid family intramembrane serine protease [Bacterioplanoides sp.]|uniref:rhomboid family intramembrane serine protease n=1 Tax=Bacterioplanoides sp. TaxID=2066072 RepID=UPI003AFF6EF3
MTPYKISAVKRMFGQQFRFVLMIAAALAVIELINLLTLRGLNVLALIPREITRLPLIITAPVLHKDTWHFASNIIPFTILSFLAMQYGKKTYLTVLLSSTLATGLGVWLFARGIPHMGLNGLVYALFGFLLVSGIRTRQVKHLAISLITLLGWGGLVFGLLPINAYISWESNIFGVLSGIACAMILQKIPVKNVTVEM